MTVVAVLGGGAGGCATAVDLAAQGHRVRLWNRRERTIAGIGAGGIHHSGVLGDGVTVPDAVTTDLGSALAGAEVAVACLPALAHGALAADLAGAGLRAPLVLCPGHTGGALHVRRVFGERGAALPPVAELSTLPYVARRHGDRGLAVSGKAGRVSAACLPGGEAALRAATALFGAARPAADVLATSLANVNMVLHPPGALLGASWVEATGGDFTFYVEGMTPGVARVVAALDGERRAVAGAYGHRLPTLLAEMAAIGTAEEAAAERGDLLDGIRGGTANAALRAPDSLAHRYYREDLGFGLRPLVALAAVAGVETPVAGALLRLGEVVVGEPLDGLDAAGLGVGGLDRDGVLALVRSRRTTGSGTP